MTVATTTISLRKFMLLGLLFILLLPWIFFVTAYYIETKSLSISSRAEQQQRIAEQLNAIIDTLESEPELMQDDSLTQSRSSMQHSAVQQQSSEQQSKSIQQYGLIQQNSFKQQSEDDWQRRLNAQVAQAKLLLADRSQSGSYQLPMLSASCGLLLAFFIVGLQMRKLLLTPLEAMGRAARHIATGKLDAAIPVSHITEMAQVGEGFTVMVSGLQRSQQKQAALEEERRFFVAAIAHDLRTPLFALRGYLDGLTQGIARSPEQIAKYVSVCKEKSAQLDLLVEDLFTFTKLEYVDNALNTAQTDLELLFQKGRDSLQPLAEQKNISLQISGNILQASVEAAEKSGKCIVNGDAHLLERVINNLLDNAVRHTPVGGSIAIQCYAEGQQVRFSVHDSGAGFSPEELKRVFEPLYRGEQSRNRSTGGSGLGLTIAQRIIRKHGGELVADNHSQGGALISGLLPAAY